MNDTMQPETTVSDDTTRQPTPEELAALLARRAQAKRVQTVKDNTGEPVYNRFTKNHGRGTPKAKRKMAKESRRRNRR